MPVIRRYSSALLTPLWGWLPTWYVNSTSSVDTGVPSPQVASGWIA